MGASHDKPSEVESKIFPEFRPKLPLMNGKVVAITGSTTGTGHICARVCAELGAHVVMLNRPSDRADAALASIQTDVRGSKVSSIPCDLMSFESVRQAAAQLKQELAETGLDVLCNNAGIMATADEATADGCDTQMQTNHLSHFLLTAEVWPLLEQAASKNGEARVVNHSSVARSNPDEPLEAEYFGKNGGNLGGDDVPWKPFSGPRWKRYQQTKLANLVFTYALDDRIRARGSKVKALVAHPGVSSTNLFVTTAGDGGIGGSFANFFMGNMSQSSEDGTCPLLTCCCCEDVTSRQFYGPDGMTGPVTLMPEEGKLANQVSRDLLWDESQKTTGINFDL